MSYVNYILGDDMIAGRHLPRGWVPIHYNIGSRILTLPGGRFMFEDRYNRCYHLLAVMVVVSERELWNMN